MSDKVEIENPTGTMIVDLSTGQKITVREPMLRDVRSFYDIENLEERQVMITSALTQMTADELNALKYADYLKLAKATESFL